MKIATLILLALLLPLSAYGSPLQDSLSLDAAIRRAWSQQSGLQAGEAMVARARSDAEVARDTWLPALAVTAGATRTEEPMAAFGMKLDQARISQADFNPASLNRPEAIAGAGGSVRLTQPIFAGGRITAGRRAGVAMAGAEESMQAFRRQQVALAVVQAYFGVQVAEQGRAFAEDTLQQAREVERFIQGRVDQGLLPEAEALRIRAFRAQAEAGQIEARQRVASARSSLGLLTELDPVPEELSTSLKPGAGDVPPEAPGDRADVRAAKLQWDAAREGVKAARGGTLPEIGLSLGVGTMHSGWSDGGNWTDVSLGLKWNLFSLPDYHRVSSAKAAAKAAELDLRWQQQVASRAVGEAQRAAESAAARIRMAEEAVAASESARTLRQARHRQGLLPLTDVLDAEAGLSGARALLLNSEYELRVSRAQLSLALGQPVEGVNP